MQVVTLKFMSDQLSIKQHLVIFLFNAIIDLIMSHTASAQQLSSSLLDRIEIFTSDTQAVYINTKLRKQHSLKIYYYIVDLHNLSQLVYLFDRLNNVDIKNALLMQQVDRRHLRNLWFSLFNSILIAKKYGLKKYPAIVINSRYILYGIRRLQVAILVFKRYLNAHDNNK